MQDWTPVTLGIWPVAWDGKLPVPGEPTTEPQATSGPYTLTVAATDAFGSTASAGPKVAVNATVTGVSLKPAWFSPNADGVSDQTVLTYKLERDATPVITIGPASEPLRIFTPGRQSAGVHQIAWDGLDDVRPGRPRRQLPVAVRATDDTGSAMVVKSVAIDTVRPRPIAVEPVLRVRRGVRIDVPYRMRDRSTTTVRTRIVITRDDGTVVKDSDRGWVTTGVLHALPFKTATARCLHLHGHGTDHAGNTEVEPAVITLTVR